MSIKNEWPYRPATPVGADPLPESVRHAIHDLVRRGARIVTVAEDPLGDAGDFRIVYSGQTTDTRVSYVYPSDESLRVIAR
jgi:hypothetical protein